jgi:hypothetical protein
VDDNETQNMSWLIFDGGEFVTVPLTIINLSIVVCIF